MVSELRSIPHASSYRVSLAWPYQCLDRSWLGYRHPEFDLNYVKPMPYPGAELKRQLFQTFFPPNVSVNPEEPSDVLALFHDSAMFPQLNFVKPDETRLSLLIGGTSHTDVMQRSPTEIMEITGKCMRDTLGIADAPDAAHVCFGHFSGGIGLLDAVCSLFSSEIEY